MNNGWHKFDNEYEMKAFYKLNKFYVDYPEYPPTFTAGWYYVFSDSRYFRRGATDIYLVFQPAAERVAVIREQMRELAEELRQAKEKS